MIGKDVCSSTIVLFAASRAARESATKIFLAMFQPHGDRLFPFAFKITLLLDNSLVSLDDQITPFLRCVPISLLLCEKIAPLPQCSTTSKSI